jgi:predicted hydrocarbon binding protein
MDNSVLAELVWDAASGALNFKEVRYLLIRPETLAQFQRAVEAEVGAERTGELLYSGGFAGGQLSGRKYMETFGLSDREAVEFMCRMGGELGWGQLRLVRWDRDAQSLEVEVTSSPFAGAYAGESRSGVCHLLRGVFGGLGATVFGVPVESDELRCLAAGDSMCQIVVRKK